MPVTRGRAKAVHSASATPSTTVSPVFSAGASPPSTPDTSVADDEDTVLKQPPVKTTKTAIASKKRVLEDVSEEEVETPSSKRGAKRRMVQQSAYVEIATKKVSKVDVIALSRSRAQLRSSVQTPSHEVVPSTTRRSSRASAAATTVIDESDTIEESDDSGSEFDPTEDAALDFADDVDESDEEALLETVVKQSLRMAREDQEQAAGLVSAGAGSSKSRPPAKKTTAATRRRSKKEEIVTELDSSDLEFEDLSDITLDESEDEPLAKSKSKGKGKQAAKGKSKEPAEEMFTPATRKELKKMTKEERKTEMLRRRGVAKDEAEMRAKLGRKLTYVSNFDFLLFVFSDVPLG